MSHYFVAVFEDVLTLAFVRNIFLHVNHDKYLHREINARGFGKIRKNIKEYNRSAGKVPFFIVTDLDTYECPTRLISDWFDGSISKKMVFRIAVREVETWLMADKTNLSLLLKVEKKHFNVELETIEDPKRFLLNIVRKSRSASIRNDLLPEADTTAKIGPNYNLVLTDFVENKWDIAKASANSASLRRAIDALSKFK